MAKKRFKIRARLVFSGEVVIAAATRQEAEAIAEFGTHAEVSVNRKEGK
jgi:hypothetical protein